MSYSAAQEAVAAYAPSPESTDEVSEGIERLKKALPEGSDTEVVVGFLEDDLREGLLALEGLQNYFSEVLEALREGPLNPIALLSCSSEGQALENIERLHQTVCGTQRRLSQSALKLRRARR